MLEVVTSLAPQEGDLAAYQNTPLSGTLVFTTEGDGSQAFMSEVPSVIKRPRRPARYRAPPAESEPEEPLQTPSVQSVSPFFIIENPLWSNVLNRAVPLLLPSLLSFPLHPKPLPTPSTLNPPGKSGSRR